MMKCYICNRQLNSFYFLSILLIISILAYSILPKYACYSQNIFITNLIIFSCGTISYFKAAKKNNYFDFDTIFVCVYFIVGYLSTFYYNSDIYPYLFLHFSFDENYINASLWLFTIGILSYYLGRMMRFNYKTTKNDNAVVNTNASSFILAILFILYLLFGGVNRYIDTYLYGNNNDGGIVVQIEILITAFVYATVAAELYNKKIFPAYRFRRLPIFIVAVITIMLLFSGNRTVPSYFILSGFGLYSLLFKSISFKKMLVLMLIGIVGMWAIGMHRSGYDISAQADAAMYVVDLTINTRNTYIAMEYVDQYGFTYGKTMLYGILGIIPLLSSILGLDQNEIGSAEVLTLYTYNTMGVDRTFIGLGTNIIADIYLSFGMLGVVILMFIVGVLIKKCIYSALKINYYSLVVYAVVISISIFGIRTGLTHICRMLVWSLVIAYFNKYYTVFLCKKR